MHQESLKAELFLSFLLEPVTVYKMLFCSIISEF